VVVAVVVRESRHVIRMNRMMNRMTIAIGRGDTVVLLEISEDNRKGKKILRSEMLTTGLAAVATIHAAHNIAKGVGRRKKRHQQLKEGEITPEKARKRKIKSNVMDAASVGIAALGIREAVSEWKEAHELRNEHKHFKEEAKERAQKRAQRRGRSQSVSYSSRKPLSNDSDDRDDDNMSEYSDDRS